MFGPAIRPWVTAKRVAVLGAGSWGTTFAKVLADGGADGLIWARRREVAHEITETHRNSGYLPGINLPRNLQVEFREDIQRITDEEGVELPSKRIYDRFIERYVNQTGARLKFAGLLTPRDRTRW